MPSRLNKILVDHPFSSYLLLALLFRLPSLFIPYLDIDEVLWGLHANAIVDGGMPYHTVMGEKPPLLYLTYAAVFALFGKHNYLAMHIVGIVWTALTSLVIFYLARRATKQNAAFFAGAAYVIFGSASGFRMLATTGELLMNLYLVLSCWAFWSGFENKNIKKIFLAGALAMIAGLFRQQSLIQLGGYAGFLTWIFFANGVSRQKFTMWFQSGLALTCGVVTILALCLFYIHHIGAAEDFYFWVVKYNSSYIQSGFNNGNVLRNFLVRVGQVFFTTLPLWLLVGKRIITKFKTPSPRPSPRGRGGTEGTGEGIRHFEIFIWFYLTVSLIATIPGGRFFPHYFLQAFPALCILAAWQLDTRDQSTWLNKLTLIYVILILCKMPFTRFEMTINDKGDYNWQQNQMIGEYVRNRTQPSDRIFIWGWAQGIYVSAQRDPAARFISSDFLSGRSPSQNNLAAGDTSKNIIPGSWNQLFSDFSEHQPVYILDTSPGDNHGYGLYPVKRFPQLQKYIAENYVFETTLEGINVYRLK